MVPNKDTIPSCILRHRDLAPGALCCSLWGNGRWTDYTRQDFWQLVSCYSSYFTDALTEKKLILFIKRFDLHLLAAYIGAMHAGHVPAQISPPNTKQNSREYSRKVEHILSSTQASALFCDEDLRGTLQLPAGIVSLHPLYSSPELRPHPERACDDALVQFSSGTTGLQKGVVLTHQGVLAHMRAYSNSLSLTPDDAIVSWLPLYHDMGLIACYLMPLVCGIPFLQMDPFDWIVQPDLLLSTIEARKPTLVFLPNFAFHVLASKGKDHDLSSIRLWINCSEPAKRGSQERLLRRYPALNGLRMTVCYALAENTFAVSQSLPDANHSATTAQESGPVSCGMPIDGVEVSIFDPNETGEGEIGVRSSFLFSRFLDGTRPLENGFYRTGDIGFLGSRGDLFVSGRKKDMIIVCGKNLFPQDIEFICGGCDGVYPGRAVAFGVWNEDIGSEDLYVLAERQTEAQPSAIRLTLQKTIRDEFGVVPRKIEILEHMSLVKTSSGKLCRSRNRDLYLGKAFTLL